MSTTVMKPQVLLHIQDISKRFTRQDPVALSHVSLSVNKGQLVALAGPDGAGKTTLLRLIAGLIPPSEGTISVCDYNVFTEQKQVHELLRYMPQRFGLYEDLTVIQNLELYAGLQNIQQADRTEIFSTLLHFTQLEKFQTRLARNLSGGMKQKLGIACTLIRKPTLLLLDEPTAGVDPISRRELWEMIFSLHKEQVTVICSTSYLEEAEKCDMVLLLDKGKKLYYGTPKDFTKRCDNRVYLIHGTGTKKRTILSQMLKDPHIVDGTIQADTVRIVTKDPGILPNNITPDMELTATPPRFEDAFIDLLGGSTKEESPIANMSIHIKKEEKCVVRANNLVKTFGSFFAVNDISFSVQQGEIFGLLGPNGAGKSTTFRMLCGLLTPTRGQAIVSGHSIQQTPRLARQQIGYMAQKFSLYDNMSVLQNLHFFHGIYANDDPHIQNEMIEIFNLSPYLHQKALSLPFGFKQRLALACAIMHKPSVLFLDEPTSGVDPITRREFWNHIHGMISHHISIIITTHFMDEAEYCDRIGLINEGKLIQIGTPEELKRKARSPKLLHPTIEDAFILLSTQKENVD